LPSLTRFNFYDGAQQFLKPTVTASQTFVSQWAVTVSGPINSDFSYTGCYSKRVQQQLGLCANHYLQNVQPLLWSAREDGYSRLWAA